jgi:hypothetical protein
MNSKWYIVVSIFLVFPFTQGSLYAQSSDDARNVCIFDLVNATEGEDREINAEVGALFADTLAIELELKGYNVLENQNVREEREKRGLSESDIMEKEKVLAFAKDLDADIAVTGFFRVSNNEVLTGIKVYDVPSGQIASALTEKGPAGLQIFDEIEGIALTVSSRIREALDPYASRTQVLEKEKIIKDTTYEEVIVELGTPAKVTILSPDEGAKVYLGSGDDHYLGAIADGKLEIQTKVDKKLVVRLEMEGHHSRTITRTIKAEEEEIRAGRLWKSSRFDLGFSWTLMAPFGASGDFRFHIIPDYLYAYGRLGGYYIPAAYYIDTMFSERFTLWGRVNAGIGGYIPVPPPPFPFRLAIDIGLGGEFFYINESAIIGDIQMTVVQSIRAELRLPTVMFFLGGQIVYPPIISIIPNYHRGDSQMLWFWEVGAIWKL